jgi:ketosteroid isomerase-like protein
MVVYYIFMTAPANESENNIALTRAFLRAVSSLESDEEIASFYSRDVEVHEFPNRIVPYGRVRRTGSLGEGLEQARKLLEWQRYEIRGIVGAGSEVAAEIDWTGKMAIPFRELPAGYEMKAFVAMFLTFRNGKIVSQRNYDCYPPFEKL